MDPDSLKAGLVMEAAQAQLHLASTAIKRLDTVAEFAAQAVGDAARSEFAHRRSETQRTAQALRSIRGGLSWNLGVLACAMAVLCTATAVGGVYLLGGIGASASASASPVGLKGDPVALAEFAKQCLQVEVALCGPDRKPCVRVDPKGPGLGPKKEFLPLPAR